MGKQLAITENREHLIGKKLYITDANGVHRKGVKAYLTVNGVHILCYKGGVDVATMAISYSASGGMTDAGIVTMSGKQYRLLTLTKSGTLTVTEDVQAEVWLCGGGTSGAVNHTNTTQGGGGAGAYAESGTVTLSGSMAAVIGAGGKEIAVDTANSSSAISYNGGGKSSFGGISVNAIAGKASSYKGVSGGTGGGAVTSTIPTGDGKSKYPFGDSSYFKCHCAGGGGGGLYVDFLDAITRENGGNGGTNGGNGGKAGSGSTSSAGAGGDYGGGAGGSGSSVAANRSGKAASFYGSGGGGSGHYTLNCGNGGAGYQGVIYIRIPVEQAS